MKINKKKMLINYLKDHSNQYVSSQELTDFLHVSSRQLRNYITNINNGLSDLLILSAKQGYKLNNESKNYPALLKRSLTDEESPDRRKEIILQKLISSTKGYDIFDLADECFVSVPTIEADLKTVRCTLNQFDLQLKREKNILFCHGKEINKRNLMSTLLFHADEAFILNNQLQILSHDYLLGNFRQKLKDIFTENDIFANDYALNNTALHLIITIDRIRSGCEINEPCSSQIVKGTKPWNAAMQIAGFIHSEYQIEINESEIVNLTLIISNNTSITDYSLINPSNIQNYIEEEYIHITNRIIHKVINTYHLFEFDDEFFVKFTLHIKNLFLRIKNNYTAKNPLTQKIKTDFPLIYDIAVYIAQILNKDYSVLIDEDEIAFIAFHIGSYLENSNKNQNKISCIFIYTDYYSMHQKAVETIIKNFENELNMKAAIPLDQYDSALMHADLIISTNTLPDVDADSFIHLSPFVSQKELKQIKNSITLIRNQKKNERLRKELIQLFSKELFYKNINAKSRETVIQLLANEAYQKGYAMASFLDDVLNRERLSSTAFNDVAVPHSLENNVNQSFISICIFDKPILWNTNYVSVVALLGLHEDSKELFAEIFDYFIEIISNPKNISILITVENYEDFIERMTDMINELSDH